MRTAGTADRDAVVATVADAFVDDPAWRHLLGEDQARTAPLFAGALFDLRVDVAGVYLAGVAAGVADEDVGAVALWEPPGGGAGAPHRREEVWRVFAEGAGAQAWHRIERYDDAVHAVAPDYPFWYLGVLGTRPERRGRGLATSVLRPVLDRAGADGVPCCLETSSEPNLAFYSGRGFAVTAEIALPDGGPRTWWLERRPAEPAS